MQESTGTVNRREAEKFYALRISEIERGVYTRPVKITVSEFGDKYLEYAKVNKRSWTRDEQIIGHLTRFFGPTVLCDIGPLLIEKYKLQRVQSVSPATINREIALLKHLFNMAERWGFYRGRNPVRDVKFLAEDNLQFRVLSEVEEEASLSACSQYLRDLVSFAINTGLRLSEILHLKWEEVDLEGGMIQMLVRKKQAHARSTSKRKKRSPC